MIADPKQHFKMQPTKLSSQSNTKSNQEEGSKFGFCNRIKFSASDYSLVQQGRMSKIHVNAAFVNSCVPKQFAVQADKGLNAQSDLIFSEQFGCRGEEYGQALYLNAPRVERVGVNKRKEELRKDGGKDGYERIVEG